MIPIYKPYINRYTTSAINAIHTEWISNYGIYGKNASDKLCEILGNKYCILMNNGTAATHCLFIALKYKYPNITKIYIPNNVFIAPWNCGLMEYDKNVFEVMKTNPNTLNIETNESYIKILEQNSAVVIVHNIGNIINVPRLKRLRPDLIFVEDNCEGIFGKYENKFSGTASFCSAISFYSNKTITTGEGGAFLTDDINVYKYILSLHSHGMTEERYIHDKIAYNYRMTNIQAAFLYEQLQDIDHILYKKQTLFDIYDTLLKELIDNNQIIKTSVEKDTVKALWMYNIIIPNIDYKHFEKYMESKNIQVRPFFYDIRKHDHLKDINISFEENISSKFGVMLPSYPELSTDEQVYIINCVKEYIQLNLLV